MHCYLVVFAYAIHLRLIFIKPVCTGYLCQPVSLCEPLLDTASVADIVAAVLYYTAFIDDLSELSLVPFESRRVGEVATLIQNRSYESANDMFAIIVAPNSTIKSQPDSLIHLATGCCY